jgi:hypothetical protein
MVEFNVKSGRNYSLLPIDCTRGFPQSFQVLFGGRTYYFWLYVNISAHLLDDKTTFIELPDEQTGQAFLVVCVEREGPDSKRELIFLRKIVPNLEYESEDIAITFKRSRIARDNLNGQGEIGSQVVGGIASRWE